MEFQVTATETVGGDELEATNTLRLAVDVEGSAPTGLNLNQTVTENVATTAGQVFLDINIQDRNAPDNIYGQYTWTVDDDRFEITGADDSDSSDITVAIEEGVVFAIDPDDGEDDRHVVTITATPNSGNFDPIVIRLTITITNSTDDDPPDPENEVPGLKDDQTGAEEESEDNDEDEDEDGGTPPSMELAQWFPTVLDDGLF